MTTYTLILLTARTTGIILLPIAAHYPPVREVALLLFGIHLATTLLHTQRRAKTPPVPKAPNQRFRPFERTLNFTLLAILALATWIPGFVAVITHTTLSELHRQPTQTEHAA